MTPSALVQPNYIKLDKNRLNTNGGGSVIDRDIQNVSTIEKLTKSKKLDFIKTKSSQTDFFTFKTREAFIYLQKTFTKVSILSYFNPEYQIQIKTNILEYAIGGVFSQINLSQFSSGHITYKTLNLNSKSKID